MALVNRSFSVNVTPGMMPPIVHVSEYDVGRAYTASILDEQGNTFTIPSGTTASIEGTLNGSVGFTQSATISNNQVSFTLSESMTAYSGKAWCKIKLTQNSQPIQTCAFILAVDRAGVEADTILHSPGFQEQINEGIAEYFDNDPPFFELPSGGQSGQALVSDGQDGAEWGQAGVEVDATLSQSGKAADAKATGDALALKFQLPSGGQSGQALFSDGFDGAFWGDAPSGGSGLTEAVKQALLLCFQNVAWVNSQGQTYYQSLADALGGGGDTPTPGPTPSGLPSAFQKVEYIESTGTQYIVTDIVPATNAFSFEIEFYRAAQSPASKAIIAGETDLTSQYMQRFSLSLRATTNKIGVYSRDWDEYTLDTLYGKKVKAAVSFYPSSPCARGTISADGQSVEVQKTSPNAPDIGEGRIVLFEAGQGTAIADVRIYSCVVKVGETVIGDLVPCYRKSDNEIGMFDMVSRQFFGNAGTGTFLKGSDVS